MSNFSSFSWVRYWKRDTSRIERTMHTSFVKFYSKARFTPLKRKNVCLTQSRTLCSEKTSSNSTTSEQTVPKDDNKKASKEQFEYPDPKIEVPPRCKTVPQILKDDVKQYVKYIKNPAENSLHRFILPEVFEFVIIGAGPVASAIAYWIRSLVGNSGTVMVIDKDLSSNPFNRDYEV